MRAVAGFGISFSKAQARSACLGLALLSTGSNHRPTAEKLHTCELSPSRGFVHTLSSGEMFHFRKQLEMFLTNDIKINRLPAEGSASCSGEAGGGTLVLCSCSSHLCTILVDNRLP